MTSINAESLIVIIPGFGEPHLDQKIEILHQNIRILSNHPWKSLSIHVFVYTPNESLETTTAQLLTQLPSNVYFHKGPRFDHGIVGEFIKLTKDVIAFENTSHVLILLDDVELKEPWNWKRLLFYQSFFDIDILSPTLTLDSAYVFPYMLHEIVPEKNNSILKFTSACELFCMLMRKDAFEKYRAAIDTDVNPWLWGLDLVLFKYLKFKVALANAFTMKHYFQNKNADSYDINPKKRNPFHDMRVFLKRFDETQESLANQPAVLFRVFEES